MIAMLLACLCGLGLFFLRDGEAGIAICAFAAGAITSHLMSRLEKKTGTGRNR